MLHFFNSLAIRRLCVLFSLLALVACGGSSSTHAKVKGGAVQGVPLKLKGEVSTFAGVFVGQDGVGTQATFNKPSAIASDGSNLYVADSLSNVIRKMVIATGAVTTLAGKAGTVGSADGRGAAARFSHPAGIASDGTYLYVADVNNRIIRKIEIATGAVSTLAGAAGIHGSVDGVGSAARFFEPRGMATDGYTLYVTDSADNTIRKIVLGTGEVSTLAGSPNLTGSADGVGAAASFSSPQGIVSDGTYLYVCDLGNNAIRRIEIATGAVTTLVLTGSSDSTVVLGGPLAITLEGANLYLVNLSNVYKVVIATGEISQQGTIPETTSWAAGFNALSGIVSVGSALYLSSGDDTISKLAIASGDVTVVAGSPFSSERIIYPRTVISDRANLYLLTANGGAIEKVNIASGVVTSFVELPHNLYGEVFLKDAQSITSDANNIYVSVDTVSFGYVTLKISIATGAISKLPSAPGGGEHLDGLYSSQYMTTDGTNIYAVDTYRHYIRKIVIATGAESVLAGISDERGSADGLGVAASFNYPMGIATDGTYLYVVDSLNNTIRKILISTGKVTTLAGSADVQGGQDGIGAAASFNIPTAITTDGTSLYISDTGNNTIRKLLLASGEVTTVAGTTGITGRADAGGAAASFNMPTSITTDGNSLFIVDLTNRSIRRIQ